MSSYPEHEKMTAIEEGRRESVQEFIDWLLDECLAPVPSRGSIGRITLATYNQYHYLDRVHITREQLMADFFGIDLKKLSAEKDAMLEEIRSKMP